MALVNRNCRYMFRLIAAIFREHVYTMMPPEERHQ